ncbi:MAG: formate dehydrogenase, partial [Nitrospirota bacterium]
MSRVRLYVPNDTSACAAGAERLAEVWRQRPDVELVRTSSRGAFFLEPMVERDSPEGRLAWCQVTADDLPKILAGDGGIPVSTIPFLSRQIRHTFVAFGVTEPLSLEAYRAQGGFAGLR